jgi:hypothetical protein
MKSTKTYRFKNPKDHGRIIEMIACSPLSAVRRINRTYRVLASRLNITPVRVKLSYLIKDDK